MKTGSENKKIHDRQASLAYRTRDTASSKKEGKIQLFKLSPDIHTLVHSNNAYISYTCGICILKMVLKIKISTTLNKYSDTLLTFIVYGLQCLTLRMTGKQNCAV